MTDLPYAEDPKQRLTPRLEIASKVLVGLIANKGILDIDGKMAQDDLAAEALIFADALLEADAQNPYGK